MRIVVITNCSARKSQPISDLLQARSLPRGALKHVSQKWQARVEECELRHVAEALYQGRGFLEAKKAAGLAGTELHIISAGLGVVAASDLVPAYSLTVTRGHSDFIGARLLEDLFQPSLWWEAISVAKGCPHPLAKFLARTPDTTFVVAMSPAYLSLMHADLNSLSDQERSRLRVIGPRSEDEVPHGLREMYIKFDNRLDGPSSEIRGTESDFPQRAGRFFVELLIANPRTRDVQSQRELVENKMKGWHARDSIRRRRLPEPELKKAVARVLRESGGYWSPALRRLRDELNIACEQKRFRKLCEEVSQSRQ
jgi:hypothetical protein